VLRLLARGHHNQEIAEELVVTERTVRAHIESLYRKLGGGSRVELLHRAKARRWLR